VKIIARFINNKLAGYQKTKEEAIKNIINVYPFYKDDDSNEYAWAKRWVTHGLEQNPPEDRKVEVINEKDWKPENYEKHERLEVLTLEKRVKKLEDKVFRA